MFETGIASDYTDLVERLNDFLTQTGSAFGLAYSGTGDGTLTTYSGGATSVAETFTITATSAANFTVVGDVSGSIGPATVGTPFNHTKVAFLLTAGGTAFISGDVFTLNTAPKWTTYRKALGCQVLTTQGNTGQLGSQNIVDGKNEISTHYWNVYPTPTLPQDVEITFFEAETIATYELGAFNSHVSSRMPKAWTFDYWTGSAWSTLDSESGHDDWTTSGVKTFTVGSPVSATKYRLHITELNNANYIRIGAFRLLRSDGVDAAFGQTIWEAPGNDGDSEILVGVHLFERQDADYFDWELAGFDGYDADLMWREQTGFHGRLYLPLWDGTIPYWFIVDGRRAIVIAKINTQYEVAYLGFLDSYFSPNQYPYPLALGGSLAFSGRSDLPDWDDTRFRWSNTTTEHHIFTHSNAGSESPYYDEDNPYSGQMRMRDLTGAWIRFEAKRGSGSPGVGYDINLVWPYCDGLELLDPNLDDGYQLFPVVLCTYVPNVMGQLNGVACVTGQDLTSETLVTIGEVSWIVVTDVAGTNRDDYLAIALD